MSNITSGGYVLLLVVLLSFTGSYFWLTAKKKANVLTVGLLGMVVCFVLLLPAMVSLQLFEQGNSLLRIAVVVGWIFVAVICWLIKRSKKITAGSILLYGFFAIGGVLLLVLIGGMAYFVYLRLFTHERDDAPLWSVFLCIFFLAVLIIAIIGQLFTRNSGGKDDKTEFDDLKKALLRPEMVYTLDLSGKGFSTLPADILKFPNLRNLDLSRNQLTTLPSELNQLKNIVQIKLSGNPIPDGDRSSIRRIFPAETEIIFRA